MKQNQDWGTKDHLGNGLHPDARLSHDLPVWCHQGSDAQGSATLHAGADGQCDEEHERRRNCESAHLAECSGARYCEHESWDSSNSKHQCKLPSQGTKSDHGGVAAVQDVPVEEAVRDLLLREEEEEALAGPHECGQLEDGPEGGLEADGQTKACQDWAEVAVQSSWGQSWVLTWK